MTIKDTSEQAYYTSSATSTISWGAETSFGFTAGDLGHISSPQEGAGSSTIAVTLRNVEDYMFSNLTPTRSTVVDLGRVDSDTDSVYSLATDGTNLWLLTVDSTTAAAFYKCTSCASTPSWSSQTAPWTGQTNLTSVSLTYDSTNSDLYGFAIKDTSEQAYFISTDATTISWGTEASLAFTAGDLGHISSPETATGTSQIAASLRQGSNYEFALAFPVVVGGRFTPIISSIEVINITATSVTVKWYTSAAVETMLTGIPAPVASSQDAERKTWHEVSFTNLSSDTLYSYGIYASQPGSSDVSTASFAFKTLPASPLPSSSPEPAQSASQDPEIQELLRQIQELQLRVIQLCQQLITVLEERLQASSII